MESECSFSFPNPLFKLLEGVTMELSLVWLVKD